MTWQALMKEELERLRQADIPEADSDIRLLAMDVAGCTYSTLILRMAEEVTEKQAQRLHAYVTERMTHKPCQYILGTQEFMGYEFATAEEVLIPRPETELLVEEACRIAENWKDTPDGRKRRVLDLCCGSGCIGISFSKLRHGRDLVELADISDAAIALTKKNRERLQADCAVIQTDLFMQIEGKYDMIVSNPPYIRTDEIPKLMAEVRDFEPHLALDGKADGLYFYDKIIREAREYLYEDGYILFEIGQDQLDAVRGLLVENGYTDIKGIKDYAGLPDRDGTVSEVLRSIKKRKMISSVWNEIEDSWRIKTCLIN